MDNSGDNPDQLFNQFVDDNDFSDCEVSNTDVKYKIPRRREGPEKWTPEKEEKYVRDYVKQCNVPEQYQEMLCK